MKILLLAYLHLIMGAEVVEKKEWFSEMNKDYMPFFLEEPRCKKKEKSNDPKEPQILRCEIFKIKVI